MTGKTRIQLSVMMFLEFFVWGSWFVTMGTYMGSALGSGGDEIGTAYMTQAWGAIIAPFVVGLIADRYFAAQRLLGLIHLGDAALLYFIGTSQNFEAFYPLLLVYMILYIPTLALANSVAFNQMEDPYLRQRGADIVDAGKQVLANLLAIGKAPQAAFSGDTVVIAADISAAELIRLRQPHLKGIILAKGGKTSHAVILAKSFEIPMIIGVTDVLDSIRENDRLIVDGTSGLIFRDPPPEIRGEYDRLRVEKEKSFRDLDRLRDLAALTNDGRFCRLGDMLSKMAFFLASSSGDSLRISKPPTSKPIDYPAIPIVVPDSKPA